MDRRFADPLDLSRLAAHAGFSKFYFVRAFKDAYGETPARYLTRRRVERAKDLLRWANLTVTEVCMLVGFSSLGSFSRRFSELVGMAPSTFQRMSAARGGRSRALELATAGSRSAPRTSPICSSSCPLATWAGHLRQPSNSGRWSLAARSVLV